MGLGQRGVSALEADRLIDEALAWPFSGWDFSWLDGRLVSEPLPWDYGAEARQRIAVSASMLDMGTGGGERLAAKAPLPARTVATESWAPNVAVAHGRLRALGAEVVRIAAAQDNADQENGVSDTSLPFQSGTFELVTCRHESFVASEVSRVLKPGGVFISQQTGPRNDDDFYGLLGLETLAARGLEWNLEFATRQLTVSGFVVTNSGSATIVSTFLDVGALVYYLKAIPWVVPGFDAGASRDRLHELHYRAESEGGLKVRQRRFWWSARKD